MRIRNFFSGLHFLLQGLIVLALVVVCFLVLREFNVRMDFSKNKVYSLSTQSIQILKSFGGEPIRAFAFYRDDQPARYQLKMLFREYAHQDSHFTYRLIDPDRMPQLAKKYRVDAYETIVIEAKGKQGRTRQGTEQAITNALAKLLSTEKKRIAFTTGYGGPSIDDNTSNTGYGRFKTALSDANYQVRETVLSRDGISQGTDLLVIGGLHTDLMPREINLIESYLKHGGDLLVLIDPVDPGDGKNVQEFLRRYGVELGNDVIVDKLSKLFGADYLIPLVTEYKPHDITQGFRLATFFPIARTVWRAKEIPEGLNVTEIAWTGPGSWAETDLKKLQDDESDFDPVHDRMGPLPIAAAVSKTSQAGRMVVIGDSDFTGNAYLNLAGNRDFILNVVAWLAGEDFLISIRPRARDDEPLFLKETDQTYLFYVPFMGLPFLTFIMGTVVFFWRRRYL